MPTSIDLASYEKAPMLEDTWHLATPTSSSSDDGDDTLPMLGGKKKEKKSRPWPERPIMWIRSPWMFLIDLVLVTLVMIFWSRSPTSPHLDLQGDIKGFVPRFAQQVVTFSPHPEFVSNHTSEASLKEAREHWMKLLPPGQGFVKVDEDAIRAFDLPIPIVSSDGVKSVGTSMMHGLHCLYLIMSEYDMMAMGNRQLGFDAWHFDHCIDYVRQLLLCGGDMSLAGEDMPMGVSGSSFLNVPHVCKNFDQMYDWLNEHRDNDQYQFGTHETRYVPP